MTHHRPHPDYLPMPRWSIIFKYALFAVCGLVAEVFGSRTLEATTQPDYSSIWAGVVTVAGLVALAGVIWPRWFWLELIGAALLASWTLVIMVLAILANTPLFAAYLLLAISVPLGRIRVLIPEARAAQAGRRR